MILLLFKGVKLPINFVFPYFYFSVPVPPKRRAMSGGGVIKQTSDIFHVSSLARSSVVPNPQNGRAKVATITRMGRKQLISWVDAPDDVYFVATDSTK